MYPSEDVNYCLCHVCFRIPTAASVCGHGHVTADGHCLYDKRYFVNSKTASCDRTFDQIGDFCYSSSSVTCRYANNYVDRYGCMPFAIFRTSSVSCEYGIRKDAYCLYNQRKNGVDRNCPKGSEFVDGYCYYVKWTLAMISEAALSIITLKSDWCFK